MRPIFCQCGNRIKTLYAETCGRCAHTDDRAEEDDVRPRVTSAATTPAHVIARLGDGQRPDWHARAACAGADPAIFYPERGDSTAFAREYCDECPARQQCLDYAMDTYQKHGVWGGLSERERRRLRRRTA